MNYCKVVAACMMTGFVASCSLLPTETSSRSGQNGVSDLFMDNGTFAANAAGSSAEEDSGLRVRKSKRGNMESYVVRGQRYHTMDSNKGYSARGVASWYGPNFHGRTTSNGEVYDMYKMTAAHKTLPLPTYARVTHINNGKSVIVKINDRGPFSGDRIIDMSFASALELGMVNDGTAMVEIRALSPEELVVLSGPKNSMDIEFDYGIGVPTEESVDVANTSSPAEGEIVAVEAVFTDAHAALPTLPATKQVASPDSLVSKAADASQSVAVVVPVATVRDGETVTVGQTVVKPASAGTDIFPAEALPVLANAPADSEIADSGIADSGIADSGIADSGGIRMAISELAGSVPVNLEASGVEVASAAVVETPLKKTAVNKSDSGYYIQAGVYADVGDAERMAVDVVLAIPAEEVHVKPLKDSHLYRVTVGPIIQDQHAEQVSSVLNEAGIENYTVRVKVL